MKNIYIINAKGDKENFSFQKLYKSLRLAGAKKKLAREITETIGKNVFSGMKTLDIYKKAKKILAKKNSKSALRFSLKQAIRELGPTGFPFEKYIGEIFKKLGFKVRMNQFLPGKCVSGYEIDFLAEKNGIIYIGECKYRNLPAERVHTDIALANRARFLDILGGGFLMSNKYKNYSKKTIIVTNTKFTARAKQYSQCVGMDLLGWKEPKNNGLENIIEEQKFYPVTILPSLKGYIRDIFVSRKMMLAQDALGINLQEFSKKFKVPLKKLEQLKIEAKILLETVE